MGKRDPREAGTAEPGISNHTSSFHFLSPKEQVNSAKLVIFTKRKR